ncbi:hypothetical protein A5819_001334 [Enterococcus sp. 7E2_DIV0204]|uniref:Phage shock protein G n=1 Tax=Candidatus Enterococcus lemimoniae TaxID=1834167 RepID=A0ABZ2T899_9ENTE|nr:MULTISPECIES: hypothetical protein [unclassified Enterococcus]OTN88842.1 hypothetical protein A5819_001334 [Enterococcus sp. 7E2_DIV0204]OTO71011.1 hypothetical protein A5866_003261 [Enterococcus sp. 12C11_DIV0727]OTP51307.1 hypothetical protein A5884_000502 [Enterococcus sp. 7D2_DIV0200]
MRQQSMLMNILMVIGLFFVGSIVLSIVLGLLGGLLWFAIKIMIPVAIAVWLVRMISGPSNNRRRYY